MNISVCTIKNPTGLIYNLKFNYGQFACFICKKKLPKNYYRVDIDLVTIYI